MTRPPMTQELRKVGFFEQDLLPTSRHELAQVGETAVSAIGHQSIRTTNPPLQSHGASRSVPCC